MINELAWIHPNFNEVHLNFSKITFELRSGTFELRQKVYAHLNCANKVHPNADGEKYIFARSWRRTYWRNICTRKLALIYMLYSDW